MLRKEMMIWARVYSMYQNIIDYSVLATKYYYNPLFVFVFVFVDFHPSES